MAPPPLPKSMQSRTETYAGASGTLPLRLYGGCRLGPRWTLGAQRPNLLAGHGLLNGWRQPARAPCGPAHVSECKAHACGRRGVRPHAGAGKARRARGATGSPRESRVWCGGVWEKVSLLLRIDSIFNLASPQQAPTKMPARLRGLYPRQWMTYGRLRVPLHLKPTGSVVWKRMHSTI